LKTLLEAALPDVNTQNGMFIERLTARKLALANAVLPQTGQLHERLIEYVSDFPFARASRPKSANRFPPL
jgi:hypothetical protein